jgi:hypothetical protein
MDLVHFSGGLLVKKIFTFYLQEKAGEWEESRLD